METNVFLRRHLGISMTQWRDHDDTPYDATHASILGRKTYGCRKSEIAINCQTNNRAATVNDAGAKKCSKTHKGLAEHFVFVFVHAIVYHQDSRNQ